MEFREETNLRKASIHPLKEPFSHTLQSWRAGNRVRIQFSRHLSPLLKRSFTAVKTCLRGLGNRPASLRNTTARFPYKGPGDRVNQTPPEPVNAVISPNQNVSKPVPVNHSLFRRLAASQPWFPFIYSSLNFAFPSPPPPQEDCYSMA